LFFILFDTPKRFLFDTISTYQILSIELKRPPWDQATMAHCRDPLCSQLLWCVSNCPRYL